MSDAQITDKLHLVVNKFLCCVPVNDIDLKDCLSSISWNEQAILLEQTINNKIVKRYPIKNSYQRAFLKNVIDILEKNFVEIHDNLYDTYCNLLSVNDNEKYSYKHYNIDNRIITLKENKNFISEGTTGLCSWQASLALSQWCLNNKNYLRNLCVLELGSGVGLVGLTALLNCELKEFYWTDCHPKVLDILAENILLNTEEHKEEYSTERARKLNGELTQGVVNCDSVNNKTFRDFSIKSDTDNSCGFYTKKDTTIAETLPDTRILNRVYNNTKINVVNLPWESVQENHVYSKIKPDLILAADVVYDNSVFKPLCGAVKYFLNLNKNCEVIFACTERNTDTLQEFLQLLESNELYVNKLTSPEPDKFFWSTSVAIRFYKITAT